MLQSQEKEHANACVPQRNCQQAVSYTHLNGHPVNDIIFCIGGIGFIEELVKLIPFLLILRFTSIARKPVDYIVIASACGLGFSFFENLMYIANYGICLLYTSRCV